MAWYPCKVFQTIRLPQINNFQQIKHLLTNDSCVILVYHQIKHKGKVSRYQNQFLNTIFVVFILTSVFSTYGIWFDLEMKHFNFAFSYFINVLRFQQISALLRVINHITKAIIQWQWQYYNIWHTDSGEITVKILLCYSSWIVTN